MIAVTDKKETKFKPKGEVDYKITMGGVDLVNQKLSSYNVIKRKGKNNNRKYFSISWI